MRHAQWATLWPGFSNRLKRERLSFSSCLVSKEPAPVPPDEIARGHVIKAGFQQTPVDSMAACAMPESGSQRQRLQFPGRKVARSGQLNKGDRDFAIAAPRGGTSTPPCQTAGLLAPAIGEIAARRYVRTAPLSPKGGISRPPARRAA